MTRKDYLKAIEVIGKIAYHRGIDSATIVEGAFTSFFSNDNPHFNEIRFHSACTDAIQKARSMVQAQGTSECFELTSDQLHDAWEARNNAGYDEPEP